MSRVMIEAAINGNAPRGLNPNIGITPAEIAADAIDTCRAGASLIHFHVRDPVTGSWSQDVGLYADVFRRVRAECQPLMWPTFPNGDDPVFRYRHIFELSRHADTRPDLGLVDAGSVNLDAFDPLTGGDSHHIYINPHHHIRYFLESCRTLRLRPTVQVFDASFLRTALGFLEQGLLDEPLLLKFYFGGPHRPFGLPPRAASLHAYLDMLRGVRCHWFAATLGGDNLPFLPTVLELGGHVRIGLEDHAYADAGQPTNAHLAGRAVEIIERAGGVVATPDDARRLLELPM